MSSASTTEGAGSVSGAPNLLEGFGDTFTSQLSTRATSACTRSSEVPGPRSSTSTAGPRPGTRGRMLMPALAEDFEVIAVDPRGIGLSAKPRDGYDVAAAVH
jgi:hypothetical protein